MEPQLVAERHDHALLHVVDLLLTVLAGVEPRLLGPAEKEELGPEAEIDGSAPNLPTVEERRDDESGIEILAADRLLEILAAENGHAASHAEATVLISIALPTSS
jgi:hypothetical protein